MKISRLIIGSAVAVVLCLVIYGCGSSGGGGGGNGGSNTPVSTVKGSIIGQVYSSSGTILTDSDGVTIKCNGSGGYYANGVFIFDSLDSGKKIIDITCPNYESTQKIVNVAESGTENLIVYLNPIGETEVINGATGGMVSDESGTVIFPPGTSFTGISGTSTNASVSITYFDPTSTMELSSFPGDFFGRVGSSDKPFETYGFISVVLTNGSGSALNLASGSTAEIRIEIPASQQLSAPSTIELWSYDTTNNIWVSEGIATKEGSSPNYYYSAVVSHFTYWNVDKVMDTVYFSGTVKDHSGAAIGAVKMKAEGLSYNGSHQVATALNGTFSNLGIKTSSTVEIYAIRGYNKTFVGTFEPPITDSNYPIPYDILLSGEGNPLVTVILNNSHSVPGSAYLSGPITGALTPEEERFIINIWSYYSTEDAELINTIPDVVAINKLHKGYYRYSVGGYPPGSSISGGSVMKASLDTGAKNYTYYIPSGSGDFWNVFALSIEAGAITGEVITINKFSNTTEFPIP